MRQRRHAEPHEPQQNKPVRDREVGTMRIIEWSVVTTPRLLFVYQGQKWIRCYISHGFFLICAVFSLGGASCGTRGLGRGEMMRGGRLTLRMFGISLLFGTHSVFPCSISALSSAKVRARTPSPAASRCRCSAKLSPSTRDSKFSASPGVIEFPVTLLTVSAF